MSTTNLQRHSWCHSPTRYQYRSRSLLLRFLKICLKPRVLHRVFAFTKKDVVDSVPDLWKPYLDENMETQATQKDGVPGESVSPKQPELLTRDTTRPEHSEPKTGIRIGPGVKAPRAVFTPDPVFPERASRENYQGVIVVNVIVDRTGRVQKSTSSFLWEWVSKRQPRPA